MTRVILKPRRARPLFARHPWLYAHSIARVEGSASAGDEVRVESAEGLFVARALWNPESTLRARLYRWDDSALDEAFWQGVIDQAHWLRSERREGAWSNAMRLVNSEGDGVSGLAVDRYDRWLVLQFTSRALWPRRGVFVDALMRATGCAGAVSRFDRAVSKLEGFEVPAPETVGEVPEHAIEIDEGGVKFLVQPGMGQKTGAYLDQAANRRAAAACMAGRRVLDVFCYTGGFGLHGLKHGRAASVLGIDSSERAIGIAEANAALNGLSAAEYRVEDVFRGLDRLRGEGARFGAVVCDPPKFARTAGDVEQALRGYARLNRAAIELLEPNGVLVTCSCSGHVDRAAFQDVRAHVSALSGRAIQILEFRGHSPDHPISVACPESEYLKCAICRVV